MLQAYLDEVSWCEWLVRPECEDAIEGGVRLLVDSSVYSPSSGAPLHVAVITRSVRVNDCVKRPTTMRLVELMRGGSSLQVKVTWTPG